MKITWKVLGAITLWLALSLSLTGCLGSEEGLVNWVGDSCPPVDQDGVPLGAMVTDAKNYNHSLKRCATDYVCEVWDASDYHCRLPCDEGTELCGKQCVDLYESHDHCGACNHACTGGYCSKGRCICGEGGIFCEEACDSPPCKGECIDPQSNKDFCGAKGKCTADEGEDFRGVSCDANSHCRGGECIPFACDDGEVLCRNTDGKLACVDVQNDPLNCGQCGWSCKDKMYGSLKTAYVSCQGGKCQYECVPSESCTDRAYCNAKECNSDVHYPDFVCSADVYKTAAYCGGCYNGLGTACKGNEPICVDSSKGYECSGSNCSNGNFCRLNGCENSSEYCGRSCVNCTKLPYVAGAECSEEGACVITKCKETFHPSADGSYCVPNTPEACAPADTTNEEAINCSGIANAVSVACTVDGACLVNSCKLGYHINDTQDGCVENSRSACGRVTAFGDEVRDCTLNAADGDEAASCNADGICEVSVCAQGYHISLDGRRCEKNTINACGAIDSNKLEDCTRWGANYKCIAGKCEE